MAEFNLKTGTSDGKVETDANGVIFQQYWRELFAVAMVILEDENCAKDAVQDVFVSMLRRDPGKKILNIGAYLYKAIRHQCFMYLRADKISEKHLRQFEIATQANTTEEAVDFYFTGKDLESAVSSLPDKCREVFFLSRFENLTNKEIANRLNISAKTVENQITRAIKVIRLSMESATVLTLISFLF